MRLLGRLCLSISGLALFTLTVSLWIPRQAESNAAYLGFLSTDQRQQYLSLADPNGTVIRQIPLPFSTQVEGFNWLPNSQKPLISIRDKVYIMTLKTAQIDAYTPINTPRQVTANSIYSVLFNDRSPQARRRYKWVINSPDGEWLVYDANLDGQYHLYHSDKDGNGSKKLTDGAGDNNMPSWSPDGQWITFVSSRDGQQQIYKIDPNGQHLQQLSKLPGYHRYPQWSGIINLTWRKGALLLAALSLFSLAWAIPMPHHKGCPLALNAKKADSPFLGEPTFFINQS